MGLEAALLTNRRGWWVLLLLFWGHARNLRVLVCARILPVVRSISHRPFPTEWYTSFTGLDSEHKTHPRYGGPMEGALFASSLSSAISLKGASNAPLTRGRLADSCIKFSPAYWLEPARYVDGPAYGDNRGERSIIVH